jgi:hypothetical protein
MRFSLQRFRCWLFFAVLAIPTYVSAAELRLRPPAVPLVTHDPYFSIWSPADRLTDTETIHWTGKPHPIGSTLRVDGRLLRIMGSQPKDAEALPQTDVSVLPTRTVYRFANSQVRLTLTFATPALPDDLDVLARPVTYVAWEMCSADNRPHSVQIDFRIGSQLAVDNAGQAIVWDRPAIPGLIVQRVGAKTQRVLARKGDDLRIDWGYVYLAAPADQNPAEIGDGAVRFNVGRVGPEPIQRHILLAYNDLYSINYFGARLPPYWRRNGAEAADMLRAAERDYAAILRRCSEFDERLLAALKQVGGERYALLCALAYRQTWAGNKIAADAAGMPLVFPKECFSNGCISTVDVLFPQAPFFLVFSPSLTKGMLVPILDYASSPRWPYDYSPHDLGTYPHATGQVYGMDGEDGGRMPVEESGNMLIILAALARIEGNADLARKYWPTLTHWADYLVANGLDPENQLCSADMFGHLPHCANLAMKALIGIGGYAQLCDRLGKPEEARKYTEIARRFAARWQEMARDNGRTRLAYQLPGTWGMKHNLIWDRVLGTNLFPVSVGDAEIAWYLKVQKPYGLPVDNRTDTSLIDWAMWSIAPARQQKDFEALVAPIFRYAHETPSRVPLSDWFVTTTGKQQGFQARPVVGGIFVRMLADEAIWRQWAGKAGEISGPWAAAPISAIRDAAIDPSKPPSGLRRLFDAPMRDPSICRAPDGFYYLTGTSPPFWDFNNENGIRVWKSKDLRTWEPLGTVWRYGASPWHAKYLKAKKPLWAPEIHYCKGTFWLTYSIPGWDGTGKTSGSGLLKSTSGKAEGPYRDVQPGERLGDEIDASLFEDDDGKVYFLWHSGKIARMKPDLSGFAEPYHWLKTTSSDPDPQHHSGLCAGIFGEKSFDHVGYEGMFLLKAAGRYYLCCSENFNGRYSCAVASATSIYGPYGPRYEAIPQGGHNTFFQGNKGQWWSTYFGPPWPERPAILPIAIDAQGRLRPAE